MSILKLAKKLNQKGDEYIAHHGLKNFHRYSAELLLKSGIHKTYDFDEIVSTIFTQKHHNFPKMEFSDLPVTLSRGEHCFIDVYFWRRRPTMIHNHHFTGAFMCLHGQNLDFEFEFKKEKKISKFHELGKVELKRKMTLGPGDVVEIDLLNRFIHQNHHHADLTVNLCFRTPELSNKNISSYLYSGLRTEKNHGMLERVHRLRRVLDLGQVDFKKFPMTDDDAIFFLTQYYGVDTQNQQFNAFTEFLNKKIKKDLKLDVPALLAQHDQILDEIENDYN